MDRHACATRRPYHNHHQAPFCSRLTSCPGVLASCTWHQRLLEVDADVGGGTGSARRRRGRRLRMHWRHAQLSLRMALAAATHHSAQPRAKEGVKGETNDAPRRPSRRQCWDRTVASAMSSFWPSMSLCCRWWNSRWTLLRWLSLRRRRRRTWRWMELVRAGFHKSPGFARADAGGRSAEASEKVSEGRRRRGRSESFPSVLLLGLFLLARFALWCLGCCLSSPGLLDFWEMASTKFLYSTLCLVRRWIHAQASVYGTFGRFLWFFYVPLYLSVACSTLFEEYSHSIFWEITCGNVVFSASRFDSGYTLTSFYGGAGLFTEFLSQGGTWTLRSVRTWHADFFFFYGSSYGTSLPEPYPYSALFGSTIDTCLPQLTRFLSDKGVDMPVVMLDSLVPDSSEKCGRSTGPVLRQVVDVPVVLQRQVRGSMVQKLWLSRSYSSSKVVDFPFVPQRQLPMVPPFRKTIEIPQLQYVAWWSMPLLCRSFSMPVVVRQVRMVQTLLNSVEVPQFQFLSWLWTSL